MKATPRTISISFALSLYFWAVLTASRNAARFFAGEFSVVSPLRHLGLVLLTIVLGSIVYAVLRYFLTEPASESRRPYWAALPAPSSARTIAATLGPSSRKPATPPLLLGHGADPRAQTRSAPRKALGLPQQKVTPVMPNATGPELPARYPTPSVVVSVSPPSKTQETPPLLPLRGLEPKVQAGMAPHRGFVFPDRKGAPETPYEKLLYDGLLSKATALLAPGAWVDLGPWSEYMTLSHYETLLKWYRDSTGQGPPSSEPPPNGTRGHLRIVDPEDS